MPEHAKFVVVESADAGLADELADRLYRWLRSLDIPAEQTREPTRGPVGAQIRLAQQGRLQVDPAALALLHVADRMDHLGSPEGILAWLGQGRAVVCAHYILASLASQWEQLDPEWLVQINGRCRAPDLTVYLETSAGAPGEAGLRSRYALAAQRLHALGHAIVVIDGRDAGGALALCQEHIAEALF